MLSQNQRTGEIIIKESCGIGHEPQVVEIEYREETPPLFFLRDSIGGALIPAQRSLQNLRNAFILIAIKPFQEFRLRNDVKCEFNQLQIPVVSHKRAGGSVLLENGIVSIELEADESNFKAEGRIPGPVRRFKSFEGKQWRGGTFLDSSCIPEKFQFVFLEKGPVRTTCMFRVDFKDALFYEVVMTLDCGQAYVKFDENFKCHCTDQIVWDFKGKELPCEVRLLEPSERYRSLPVYYHIDHRMARLFSWTQSSQLFDLSDGFELVFPEGDGLGFVALEGGKWEGGCLNHLELWARRWRGSDPATRRGLPPEAKADSFPCPDKIPARGGGICEPHLNLEGWIGGGAQDFRTSLFRT